jgi:hypothetical protein
VATFPGYNANSTALDACSTNSQLVFKSIAVELPRRRSSKALAGCTLDQSRRTILRYGKQYYSDSTPEITNRR